MSVTRYQEQVAVCMSVIELYLSELEMSGRDLDGLRKSIKRYARWEVYLAFAKQELAIERLEEEEQA
jgi:hypothetical protein